MSNNGIKLFVRENIDSGMYQWRVEKNGSVIVEGVCNSLVLHEGTSYEPGLKNVWGKEVN